MGCMSHNSFRSRGRDAHDRPHDRPRREPGLGVPGCGDVAAKVSGAPEMPGGATWPAADAAYLALGAVDDVLARLIGVYGQPDPFEWFDGGRTSRSRFAAMVLHVTSQRISAEAAFSVFDRITSAGGAIPGPDTVLALGADRLRSLGLSGSKSLYPPGEPSDPKARALSRASRSARRG